MARVIARQQPTTFLSQIRQFMGRRVEVATTCDTVIGTLRNVFANHIALSNEDGNYFIRINTICWVRPEALRSDVP